AEHGDVADVEAQVGESCELERIAQELLHFKVGVDVRGAVDLGADLQRLARRARGRGPRVEHAAAVAQAGHAFAIQEVRIDARDLRGDVGAHAHHAAGDLVDHLEGAQLKIVPGA